jgi:DNA-binding GntR family transcriptional regulator
MSNDSRLNATAPLYVVVAQSLRRDIELGKFKVGELLPTELELCEQFGVSRYTAREAVRRLTGLGMVSRRAGIGTTVKARTARSRYTASVSDLTELFAFNRQARLDILSEGPVTIRGDLSLILPDAEGQVWYRFSALRRVAETPEPIVHSTILMRPGYEAVRDRIRDPGIMVYELIEQLHGERIVEFRQDISSVRMTREVAHLLGTKTGSPALQVVRYYVGAQDKLLSVAINTHPNERFKLTSRWRLDRDADAG